MPTGRMQAVLYGIRKVRLGEGDLQRTVLPDSSAIQSRINCGGDLCFMTELCFQTAHKCKIGRDRRIADLFKADFVARNITSIINHMLYIIHYSNMAAGCQADIKMFV